MSSKHGKKDNYKKDNYQQREERHYDSRPDNGFFDEAIQFSKRRLFSAPEDDDHFFDDVKHYDQKQQPQHYQQQQYPSKYPQQNAYHKQQERWETTKKFDLAAFKKNQHQNEIAKNVVFFWIIIFHLCIICFCRLMFVKFTCILSVSLSCIIVI